MAFTHTKIVDIGSQTSGSGSDQKGPDPTGSGSGSGSATLLTRLLIIWSYHSTHLVPALLYCTCCSVMTCIVLYLKYHSLYTIFSSCGQSSSTGIFCLVYDSMIKIDLILYVLSPQKFPSVAFYKHVSMNNKIKKYLKHSQQAGNFLVYNS
jgi:hypothetical protein